MEDKHIPVLSETERARWEALHVPEDAGEFTEQLTAILRRIPDGWGRWISCDAGWYPLIVDLDARIAALAPDYELHQVKEKFGGLRYYIHSGLEDAEVEAALDAAIREAEEQACRTCERCGAAGSTGSRGGWYKTLCAECADSLGYDVRTPKS